MPRYRKEITALNPYVVGRPIGEVAREVGMDPASIVKLTANESPEGPFPGVIEAGIATLRDSNRYPDNDLWELGHALAAELGVNRSNLLFGNGSTALISDIVSAVGGQQATVVYGWPSFIMYRFVTTWAGSSAIEVPLDDDHVVDLDAMTAAIDETTTCVILCNPNNPTGTLLPADAVERFIGSVPDDVLVVVDEAYHEFVQADNHRSQIPVATKRRNVVVLRTFSKIYSLASHRIGYAVGHEETLRELRKAQQPLTVSSVAQAVALASLGQSEELARRADTNAAARHYLAGAIAERGLAQVESHTNFIFFKMPGGARRAATDRFVDLGVILRPMSEGWVRVTVGTDAENRRFVDVLDRVLGESD